MNTGDAPGRGFGSWLKRLFGGDPQHQPGRDVPPLQRGLAILVLAVMAGGVGVAAYRQLQPAASPETSPGRVNLPTLRHTLQQLIDAYNRRMSTVDRTMLLPPAGSLDVLSQNSHSIMVRHQVSQGTWVVFEIDKAANLPFSMNAMATPSGGAMDSVRAAAAIAMIGTTVVGLEAAGGDKLVGLCTAAAQSNQSQRLMLHNLEMYCAVVEGLWLSGVTARPAADPSKPRLQL